MPTYQNNQNSDSILSGPHGENFTVAPGDIIEVPFFINDANFTKILDTPLSSRTTATTPVYLSGSPVDHPLNAATRKFMVLKITGSVTVRPQRDDAVAILLDWTAEDVIILFSIDDYSCEKLRISGSGSCTIMEVAY